MPLPGDAMTAGSIGLEGHDEIFARKPKRPLRYPAPVTNSLIQATRRSGGIALFGRIACVSMTSFKSVAYSRLGQYLPWDDFYCIGLSQRRRV
jgi:hypothetical protein